MDENGFGRVKKSQGVQFAESCYIEQEADQGLRTSLTSQVCEPAVPLPVECYPVAIVRGFHLASSHLNQLYTTQYSLSDNDSGSLTAHCTARLFMQHCVNI